MTNVFSDTLDWNRCVLTLNATLNAEVVRPVVKSSYIHLIICWDWLINKKAWKGKKSWCTINRFVHFPRCCALGVLPLTTWASAHLHIDEQWQSRKTSEEGRKAGREGGDREGGVCWSKSTEDKKGEQAQICSTALIWRVRAAEATLWCTATLADFAYECSCMQPSLCFNDPAGDTFSKQRWL